MSPHHSNAQCAARTNEMPGSLAPFSAWSGLFRAHLLAPVVRAGSGINLGLLGLWIALFLIATLSPRKPTTAGVVEDEDSNWYWRLLMSIVVFGGAVFGLLMLLADLVMMRNDRTSKVVIK